MTERRSQPWTLSGIGLVLALGFGVLLTRWGETCFGRPWGSEVLWWVAALVVLAYVIVAERRPLASIGFRAPGGWDIGLGVIFGVVLLVGAGYWTALYCCGAPLDCGQ